MSQYACVPGVDLWNCSRGRYQRRYGELSNLSFLDEQLIGIRSYIAVNYRLKEDDIAYIFDHAEADMIIVDQEYLPLMNAYRKGHPDVPIIVDTDTDATEGQLSGPFDGAVLEGLQFDSSTGALGWQGLQSQAPDEEDVIAIAYTSGTTSKPKGVEYTNRGCYLAAMGNVIESGLNIDNGRCHYLWTLPLFHAMGRLSRLTGICVAAHVFQDGHSRGRLHRSAEPTTA